MFLSRKAGFFRGSGTSAFRGTPRSSSPSNEDVRTAHSSERRTDLQKFPSAPERRFHVFLTALTWSWWSASAAPSSEGARGENGKQRRLMNKVKPEVTSLMRSHRVLVELPLAVLGTLRSVGSSFRSPGVEPARPVAGQGGRRSSGTKKFSARQGSSLCSTLSTTFMLNSHFSRASNNRRYRSAPTPSCITPKCRCVKRGVSRLLVLLSNRLCWFVRTEHLLQQAPFTPPDHPTLILRPHRLSCTKIKICFLTLLKADKTVCDTTDRGNIDQFLGHLLGRKQMGQWI